MDFALWMPSQYMAVVRSKLNHSRTEWSKVQTRTDRTQLATNEVNCRPDGYNTLYIQQFMPLAWPPTLFYLETVIGAPKITQKKNSLFGNVIEQDQSKSVRKKEVK